MPTSKFKERSMLLSVVFTASTALSGHMLTDLSAQGMNVPSYVHKNSEHEIYQAPATGHINDTY